ncbi:MAG: hypothetical protein KF752_15010 [Pirellulaceae bacterium]|nr:hypothetical protein [Pirellulaceae bacterium]
MARISSKFPSSRLSTRRTVAVRAEPALGLRLLALQPTFQAGDTLEFEYSIQRISAQLIDRLEVSVVWSTEGKGSDELGVIHFESHVRSDLAKRPLSQPRRVSTLLPSTPHSFEGRLFKIRWCIRLRLFLGDGREIAAEQTFYLGQATTAV